MKYKPCKMPALNGDIANVQCPASQPAVQQPTTTHPPNLCYLHHWQNSTCSLWEMIQIKFKVPPSVLKRCISFWDWPYFFQWPCVMQLPQATFFGCTTYGILFIVFKGEAEILFPLNPSYFLVTSVLFSVKSGISQYIKDTTLFAWWLSSIIIISNILNNLI